MKFQLQITEKYWIDFANMIVQNDKSLYASVIKIHRA